MIKIPANSAWERQAVFLMMQFANHMSQHKWNCFLKIMPARLAKHSIGWKWIKSYAFCLLLLLSITLCDLLQYLSCKATVTLAGTVKNYFGPVLQMESFKSKRSKRTKAEEIQKYPLFLLAHRQTLIPIPLIPVCVWQWGQRRAGKCGHTHFQCCFIIILDNNRSIWTEWTSQFQSRGNVLFNLVASRDLKYTAFSLSVLGSVLGSVLLKGDK